MKAIIFDVDGTLLDSMTVDTPLYFSAIATVLGPVNFRENIDDYDHVSDVGIVRQTMQDNGLSIDQRAIGAIEELFVAELTEQLEADGPCSQIPGAAKFIRQLRNSKEYEIAIATGGWRASALLKLRTSGLDVQDIPLASSDDSPSRTEIMQIALSRLDGEYESAVYFGDAEWDRRACEILGWKFIAVGPDLNGITSYDEISMHPSGALW